MWITEEGDTPEKAYRRGYQQGAYTALEAVGRLTVDKLRYWVDVSLMKWRHEKPETLGVQPPKPN